MNASCHLLSTYCVAGTVLSILKIFIISCHVKSTIVIPSLEMKKLRLEELRDLSGEGHCFNPGSLASRACSVGHYPIPPLLPKFKIYFVTCFYKFVVR